MQSFREVVKTDLKAVDKLIIDELHSEVGLVEQIGHYLIGAGGKRLRPLIVLLLARATGYRGADHLYLAVVIEFIHTATLLHDDVVDTSELRRGKYTANARWDNASSVLVGDFLYSRAFQMLVRLGNLDIMHVLADTTNIIAEGEVDQLVRIGDAELDEQDYFSIIGCKTAQLFAGASESAAILGQAPTELAEALKAYGWHLGLAYQLIDDVLDYRGDSGTLGKNAGDDLAEGKLTLPVIHGLKNGSTTQVKALKAALKARDSGQVESVFQILEDVSSLEYTVEQARRHINLASAGLSGLNPSPHRQALLDLAEFVVTRVH